MPSALARKSRGQSRHLAVWQREVNRIVVAKPAMGEEARPQLFTRIIVDLDARWIVLEIGVNKADPHPCPRIILGVQPQLPPPTYNPPYGNGARADSS